MHWGGPAGPARRGSQQQQQKTLPAHCGIAFAASRAGLLAPVGGGATGNVRGGGSEMDSAYGAAGGGMMGWGQLLPGSLSGRTRCARTGEQVLAVPEISARTRIIIPHADGSDMDDDGLNYMGYAHTHARQGIRTRTHTHMRRSVPSHFLLQNGLSCDNSTTNPLPPDSQAHACWKYSWHERARLHVSSRYCKNTHASQCPAAAAAICIRLLCFQHHPQV